MKISLLGLGVVFLLISCKDAKHSKKTDLKVNETSKIKLKSHSKTPNFLKLDSAFLHVEIYPILSSEDKLSESPNFVYGSMADGCALLKNEDGTYNLINNTEADYAIARIKFDETFKPVHGEYIVNSIATGSTAQCSGSLITPKEHGFGPLYLSGGEWEGASKGIFATDPYKDAKDASSARMLGALGEWVAENAVAIGKNAYPDKTVIFIGDDHGDDEVPSGQLGMYVGKQGDLEGGKLYGLKVTDATVTYEVDMKEGQAYNASFVELNERQLDLLDTECKEKGVMGFSRVEDIDWRKGTAENNREIYFCVTGRSKPGLIGKGTKYGRVYKVKLDEKNPLGTATITCVLDGDNLNGKAKLFHSPDNIVVTENYAYIQEDPNGYFDLPEKNHKASLYQYNLNNGELKKVLECDQVTAEAKGYGSNDVTWEITGMIDISETIGVPETFLLITQNHGWENNFTDPKARPTVIDGAKLHEEGSVLHLVHGLKR